MLEYFVLLKGNHDLRLPGLGNHSMPVRFAVLNGFFLFLYVSLRIFGAGSMSPAVSIVAVVVILAANLVVLLQPDLGALARGLMQGF